MANESKTRDCPYCKEEIKVDAIMCKHCHSKVAPEHPDHGGVCPFCKEHVNPEAIKCKYCGSQIGTTADAAGAVPLLGAALLEKELFTEFVGARERSIQGRVRCWAAGSGGEIFRCCIGRSDGSTFCCDWDWVGGKFRGCWTIRPFREPGDPDTR